MCQSVVASAVSGSDRVQCSCWRALVRGRYGVIIIIKLEVNLKMTGWSKFAHTMDQSNLRHFMNALSWKQSLRQSRCQALLCPAHPVLVSSAHSQTRTRLGRGPSQNQSKLSIFLMSVFRQTGLRASRVIFAQSSFQILTSRHTHSRSDERQGNQHSLCSLSLPVCWRLSNEHVSMSLIISFRVPKICLWEWSKCCIWV